MIPPAPLYTAESVGISSAPLKPAGAAVPPPGVDAAPPWTDPHKDDDVKPVGASQCQPHMMQPNNSFSVLHRTQELHPRSCPRRRKCRGSQPCWTQHSPTAVHWTLYCHLALLTPIEEGCSEAKYVHPAMQGRTSMLRPQKICGSGFSSTPWPATWSQMAADLRWQPCLLKELTPSLPSCLTFAPQSMHTTGAFALLAASIGWTCICSVHAVGASCLSKHGDRV